MTFLFLVIIGGILIYFYSKNKGPKKQLGSKSMGKPKPAPANAPQKKMSVYTKKGLRDFSIVGANHFGLDRIENQYPTPFMGYIKCIAEQRLGVFRDDNRQIAHVPKSNTKLYNSILTCHNGNNMAWGNLCYDGHDKKWTGSVTTPLGYTTEEGERIKNIFHLMGLNNKDIARKDKSSEEYLNILERHKRVVVDIEELKLDLHYQFPRTFIPSVSKYFEKEKNWKGLIELENYMDLIENLSDLYKNATLKRIDIAKSNL